VAAVVDPQRDIEIYLEYAKEKNLKIAYILETHLHADFVSGHNELARRTSAKIYVGAQAGAEYPHVAVKEGDEVRFGKVVLRFLETPGHTPESMCVLVTDLERGAEPWAVLTGDTLFIGDVGRPDLSPTHTPQELAGLLYDSLHAKLLTLPDSVEVYPAHGAGSLCGRNISPERRSTIGKERKLNYALQPMKREEFVRLLTADLPERPEYFARDAEINRTGAAPLEEMKPLAALSPREVQQAQREGAIVLDTRPAAQFGAAHVPGSVQIGLGGQYASWAARLIGLDKRVILVAEDPERLEESRMRLTRVGMEKVIGTLNGGMLAWEKAGLPLAEIPQISVHQLREFQAGGGAVADVRNAAEWESGHLEGALHEPIDQLGNGQLGPLASVDRATAVAVHCKSGFRSSIATSLLERAGFKNVMNVTGGFDAWAGAQLPVVGSAASACATK
jgi:glyoxylase-like metal-dependent hydrolase (beta-lactamase superfamily II)/rhodanese-related sulfurtransferase